MSFTLHVLCVFHSSFSNLIKDLESKKIYWILEGYLFFFSNNESINSMLLIACTTFSFPKLYVFSCLLHAGQADERALITKFTLKSEQKYSSKETESLRLTAGCVENNLYILRVTNVFRLNTCLNTGYICLKCFRMKLESSCTLLYLLLFQGKA